jgi:hypothetical protein
MTSPDDLRLQGLELTEQQNDLSFENLTTEAKTLLAPIAEKSETKPIETGDIVKITKGAALKVFVGDLASVSMILEPYKAERIDKRDIPIVPPDKNAHPREREEYLRKTREATRVLINVYLTGNTVEGATLRKEVKTEIGNLRKMPSGTVLPEREQTPQVEKKEKKKATRVSPGPYGNGGKFHNPTEIKNDRPRRKRNADND